MNSFCSKAYTSGGLTEIGNRAADGEFTYILKGYPCALKEKFITEIQNSSDCECEIFYDYNEKPFSLRCRGRHFRVIDGTHSPCEPETYGITDKIIDMSAFQNPEILRNRKEEALELFAEIKKEEKRCTGFISAAKAIADDCRRVESPALSVSKINRFASRLWGKHGTPPRGKIGTEKKYFAEVLTENGADFAFRKFGEMCRNIFIIKDFSSAASSLLTEKIRLYALSCGYDIISFIDFLDGQSLRHIIVPDLEFGIYCERAVHAPFESVKYIRKGRFLKEDYSESCKNRVVFCKKAYTELTGEAVKSLKIIENHKKVLDNLFISATNEKSFLINHIICIYNN